MTKIFDIIKGFFIGIANVVPGVSGGTLAIILKIYDKLINAVNDLFSTPIKAIKSVFFIGIGIVTENEKVYVQKYLAQKQTIEMSLESEELTGLERVQLVTKATELNGEFAEKKARFNLWHFVVYDNTIYDGVELIDLKGDSARNNGN